MKMQKRQFKIGEIAQKIGLERSVIRFWEKEFALKSDRSRGGQRLYGETSFKKLCLIKTLLYEKKFTIAGAKKQLEGYKKTNLQKKCGSVRENIKPAVLTDKIIHIQEQLIKIRELL